VNIAFEYIKYKWNAKGRHGIHSPFIFELVDKTFKIEFTSPVKSFLNATFDELGNTNKMIEIKDFGAGSHKLGKSRKINQIFNTSSSKENMVKFFFNLQLIFSQKKFLNLALHSVLAHYIFIWEILQPKSPQSMHVPKQHDLHVII